MNEKRRILAQVIIELGPRGLESTEAIKGALQSAIQIGLCAQVQDLRISKLEDQVMVHLSDDEPPASRPSSRDQVIEEYLHSGMLIQISRDAGMKIIPSYFAVVLNPQIKNPTGAVITAKSYAQLKVAAQARAARKSVLFERKQAKLLDHSSAS